MYHEIKQRSRSSAKVLALRNAVTQILRIGSSVVVARWLDPEDFGLYAVVIYLSGLPIYFQNLGLGAALIQRKDEPTQIEWTTSFYAQLAVAGALFFLIAAFGRPALGLFSAPAEAYSLLIVSALPSLISALSFYQRTWLQRHMEFRKLAGVTLMADVASVVCLCLLAITGFGVWTLVLAPLVAGLVNLAGLFAVCPWRPSGPANLGSLRPLCAAGVPMQLSAAMPAALDGWMPLYTNRLLGLDALGFLNLAQRLAAIPSGYLQVLNQVAFPAFSRLQHDPSGLLRALHQVLYRLVVVLGIGYLIVVGWLPDVVTFVYGAKWNQAGRLLQYLGLSVILIGLASIMGPALNALGRHWLRTIPLLAGYAVAWSFGYGLINGMGYTGLGISLVLFGSVQLVGLAMVLPQSSDQRRRILRISLWTVLACFLTAGALAGPVLQSLVAKCALTLAGLGLLVCISLYERRHGYTETYRWCIDVVSKRRVPDQGSKSEE
jgi:teichuronic acid exporter